MAILLMLDKHQVSIWHQELLACNNTLDIRVWPDTGNIEDINFAVVWRAIPDTLNKLKNLKCIASIGAGVDYILRDNTLPNVPIVRMVDKILTKEMAQYIVHAVVHYTKNMELYRINQAKNIWQPELDKRDITIGLLGVGEMGQFSGEILSALGFNVIGFRNSNKQLDKIKCYHGDDQFKDFLNITNILICLLPLTKNTKGILNKNVFDELPNGAYLINAGRGEHMVTKDVIQYLDNDKLKGACLDVFPEEPLDRTSALWQHKKVRITPHIASMSNPKFAAKHVYENYERMLNNKKLKNIVDINREY